MDDLNQGMEEEFAPPHIKEMFDNLDFSNYAKVQEFTRSCAALLPQSKVCQFDIPHYLSVLPKRAEYLEAGDYIGAITKFSLALYADCVSGNASESKMNDLRDKKNELTIILRQADTLERETPEYIAGALISSIAATLSHLATCDNHDVSNPWSVFQECRHPFMKIMEVPEFYAEVCSNVRMLIIGATASKGGYLEKDPILNQHIDRLLKTWDETPIANNEEGLEYSKNIGDTIRGADEYPERIAKLIGLFMMCIQSGIIGTEYAKQINSAISDYITALQSVA